MINKTKNWKVIEKWKYSFFQLMPVVELISYTQLYSLVSTIYFIWSYRYPWVFLKLGSQYPVVIMVGCLLYIAIFINKLKLF